ncbi:MAG: hypothetical protein ACR2M2_00450 [Gaiellaceae bacterium]
MNRFVWRKGDTMRRIAQVLLALGVILAMVPSPASARSLTVRTDPDDTRSMPDIRKVWSDVSPSGVVVKIGTWDRLRSRDERFSVVLDTRGSVDYDRIIEVGPACVVEKLRNGSLGRPFGQRPAHRPSKRTISCLLPTGWFGIRKTVRFVVLTGAAGEPHDDRAPNDRRFVGL